MPLRLPHLPLCLFAGAAAEAAEAEGGGGGAQGAHWFSSCFCPVGKRFAGQAIVAALSSLSLQCHQLHHFSHAPHCTCPCLGCSPACFAHGTPYHTPFPCSQQDEEEEKVRPRVPFSACLEGWGADSIVEDYQSAAAGKKVVVSWGNCIHTELEHSSTLVGFGGVEDYQSAAASKKVVVSLTHPPL